MTTPHAGIGRTAPMLPKACLIGECATIFARIRTRDENSIVPIDPDCLGAADWSRRMHEIITQIPQTAVYILWKGPFDFDGPGTGLREKTRQIDRLLKIETVIENARQKVGVAQSLVVTAHHPKRHLNAPIF